jgi:hypothetical protein
VAISSLYFSRHELATILSAFSFYLILLIRATYDKNGGVSAGTASVLSANSQKASNARLLGRTLNIFPKNRTLGERVIG